MYIPELSRELNGRKLDIWRGHDDAGRPIDMPAAVQERYRRAWLSPAPGTPPPPIPPPAPPCRFRGDELTPAQRNAASLSHHKLWLVCEHPETPIGPFVCGCQGCGPGCRGYAADVPDVPRVGVAVGCYGMPGLARLQVRAIRAACGPDVPILLADDGSPHGAAFREIAAAEAGVTFWPNVDRLGHYAGDLSVFWKALQWAVTADLDYVCKLSQRFVWTSPGWLAGAVSALSGSPYATLMQRCEDNGVNLYARTECMLFKTARWGSHYAEFTPRGDLNNPTELAVWHHVHTLFGGEFLPWDALPVNRYAPAAGTLWHGSHPEAPYREYAASLGVDLGADFYTAGAETRPDWKRG